VSELQEAAAERRGDTRVGDDLMVSPVRAPGAVARTLSDRDAWRVVGQAAAMLAMGIGRFAFTPILPLMTTDAGLSASGGAVLATVKLVGYLAGAVIGVSCIIAAAFLVAAIEQQAPGWVGDGAWVLVGLAALPSTALWALLTTRVTGPMLLTSALGISDHLRVARGV